MITVRKSGDRGHFDHGWLDTRHTFSFAAYHDPEHMGFRGLRVINEDVVEPGQGFGRHGHRDMEIISYVLSGALAHEDSSGGGGVLRPGDVQRMSAGGGITHSEFNGSEKEPVHFLQIWLLPGERGIEPGYDQKHFPAAERTGKLSLIASPDQADGSLVIHADARVYASVLGEGQAASHRLGKGRHAWVQVARGAVEVNGTPLEQGDGAAITGEAEVVLRARGAEAVELLLFDLA
jgi:redox-sensitive bicupin YhaK (pirin superfamily)